MQIEWQDTNADISTRRDIHAHSGGAAHRVIVLANRAPFRHEIAAGRPRGDCPLGERRGHRARAAARSSAAASGSRTGRHPQTRRIRLDSTRRAGASRYRVRWVAIDEREYRGFYHGLRQRRPVAAVPRRRRGAACSGPRTSATTGPSNARFADAVVRGSRRRGPDRAGAGLSLRARAAHDPPAAAAPATIVSFWHIPWPDAERFGAARGRRSSWTGCSAATSSASRRRGLHATSRVASDALTRGAASTGCRRRSRLRRPIDERARVSRRRSRGATPWRAAHRAPRDCRAAGRPRALGLAADTRLVVGVDRLDYTKGIEEKLLAVERLLEREPELRGTFVFVAARRAQPRRARRRTGSSARASRATAQRINERFGTGHVPADRAARRAPRRRTRSTALPRRRRVLRQQPARRHEPGGQGVRLRPDDEQGVLVLSRFTGAAQQLHAAVSIDPFNPRQSAVALLRALQHAGGGADAPYARAEGDRRGVRRGLVGAADDP